MAEGAAQIGKGKISTIEGPLDRNNDETMARILPDTRPDQPSRKLIIPWWLRGEMGKLVPGTPVVYILFEDMDGIIVSRTDGNWDGTVPGDVRLEDGSLTVDKDAAVKGNTGVDGDLRVKGTATAAEHLIE